MRTLEFWKDGNLLDLKISGVANEDNFKVLDAHSEISGKAIGIAGYWASAGMDWHVGDSLTIVEAKDMAENTLDVDYLYERNGQAAKIDHYIKA